MEMLHSHSEEDSNLTEEISEAEHPPLSKLLSSAQVFISGRFSIRGFVPDEILNNAVNTFSTEVNFRKKYEGSEVHKERVAELNRQLRRLQVMLVTRYANAVGDKNLFDEKQKILEQTTILTCAINAEDSLEVLTAEKEIRSKDFNFPEIALQRSLEDFPTDIETDINKHSTSSPTDISEF